MAATVINVSAVEESTARALRFVSEQQDSLNAIDRVINNMGNAWESEAQKAFAESFRTTREKIDTFSRSVTQSVENMKTFVSECVNADELTAREIRGVNW